MHGRIPCGEGEDRRHVPVRQGHQDPNCRGRQQALCTVQVELAQIYIGVKTCATNVQRDECVRIEMQFADMSIGMDAGVDTDLNKDMYADMCTDMCATRVNA